MHFAGVAIYWRVAPADLRPPMMIQSPRLPGALALAALLLCGFGATGCPTTAPSIPGYETLKFPEPLSRAHPGARLGDGQILSGSLDADAVAALALTPGASTFSATQQNELALRLQSQLLAEAQAEIGVEVVESVSVQFTNLRFVETRDVWSYALTGIGKRIGSVIVADVNVQISNRTSVALGADVEAAQQAFLNARFGASTAGTTSITGENLVVALQAIEIEPLDDLPAAAAQIPAVEVTLDKSAHAATRTTVLRTGDGADWISVRVLPPDGNTIGLLFRTADALAAEELGQATFLGTGFVDDQIRLVRPDTRDPERFWATLLTLSVVRDDGDTVVVAISGRRVAYRLRTVPSGLVTHD
jgi:hypothetical protein